MLQDGGVEELVLLTMDKEDLFKLARSTSGAPNATSLPPVPRKATAPRERPSNAWLLHASEGWSNWLSLNMLSMMATAPVSHSPIG